MHLFLILIFLFILLQLRWFTFAFLFSFVSSLLLLFLFFSFLSFFVFNLLNFTFFYFILTLFPFRLLLFSLSFSFSLFWFLHFGRWNVSKLRHRSKDLVVLINNAIQIHNFPSSISLCGLNHNLVEDRLRYWQCVRIRINGSWHCCSYWFIELTHIVVKWHIGNESFAFMQKLSIINDFWLFLRLFLYFNFLITLFGSFFFFLFSFIKNGIVYIINLQFVLEFVLNHLLKDF